MLLLSSVFIISNNYTFQNNVSLIRTFFVKHIEYNPMISHHLRICVCNCLLTNIIPYIYALHPYLVSTLSVQ
jgi:hypothetical protein